MRKLFLLLCMSLSGPGLFGAQSTFDPEQKTWSLTNDWIRADFRLAPDGTFSLQRIADSHSGDLWPAAANRPSTPILFQASNETYDALRAYTLIDQYAASTTPAGVRQFIVLQDVQNTALITLILD